MEQAPNHFFKEMAFLRLFLSFIKKDEAEAELESLA